MGDDPGRGDKLILVLLLIMLLLLLWMLFSEEIFNEPIKLASCSFVCVDATDVFELWRECEPDDTGVVLFGDRPPGNSKIVVEKMKGYKNFKIFLCGLLT